MSKKSLMWYSAIGHAYFHMFTAFYFVIVLSLELEWQLPYSELTELWSPGALLVGVFALVAGWLGDRWSASGMLAVYFIGMGLCSIVAGYADSPLTLLLALCGLGLFAAIYHPVGIPLVIRNSGAKQGRALAINGVFGSLGAAMAGVVTGFLADMGGSYLAFVLPGAIVAATGVMMTIGLASAKNRALRPSNAPNTVGQSPLAAANNHARTRRLPFLVLLFCLAAAGLIYHATQTAAPKVFEVRLVEGVEVGIKTVGYYVALIYGIAGLCQFIGGALADKYNLKLIYLCHFTAHGALLLFAAHAGGLYLVLALGIAVSLGASALPAENMLLARYTPSRHHGVAFGLKFVLFFASAPIGVLLVSGVHRMTGEFVWVFLTLVITAVIICLTALALPRNPPQPIRT